MSSISHAALADANLDHQLCEDVCCAGSF